ncbi:MAG: tRNA 2-thiouridine(34) synthase MnmA [Thermoleophilia bacterium]
MPDERFEDHLTHPRGRGCAPAGAHDGVAGGAACGDLVRFSLAIDGERVIQAGFEVSGCGTMIAAGSAAVELVENAALLEAARIGSSQIAAELGGLSAGKLHAADLVSDALHRALGQAVRAHGALATNEGRTLVAMSGGVDSAVAAMLTDAADVATVTLELWADVDNDGERSCCSAAAVRSARRLAHSLGMAHFTLDLREEFRGGVVDPWLREHADGLTPNPCVRCNGHVRLDAMLDFADRLGAATLTTGHYARRTADGLLRLAADPAKDQTYMLAALGRESLARLRFPLGEHTKAHVRALAEQAGLEVARKPESQDLCFLAGTGRAAFLARHGGLSSRPGDIVDGAGRVLGRHDGHHGFTVGQRKGLGIAATQPLYVIATDARANTVTVGTRDQLATSTVRVRGLRLHGAQPDAVRLRYHSPALPCRLDGDQVELDEPFDGAAPGQTAVFLRGDAIVGCATIAA